MSPRSNLHGVRIVRVLALAAFLCAGSGCVRYKARPLEPSSVLRQLQRLSMDDLVTDASRNAAAKPQKFDPSDGLDADELAFAALLLNPALKAKRLEKGIAAGQLITAGLWPNPEFDSDTRWNSTGAGATIEPGISVEVLRWWERAAERQAAKANLRAVHFEILAEEWRVVSAARAAYWEAVATRERLRVSREALALAEKLAQGIRRRFRQGAGNALEQNLAELRRVQFAREVQEAEARQSAAGRALRRVIGLPPSATLTLQIPEKPFALRSRSWTLSELLPRLADSAFLKEAQWRYAVSEGELRAAITRQYPGLRLGPSGEFDLDGGVWTSFLGFLVSFDLPFLNRNQGEIRSRYAARTLARAAYTARLHEVRAGVADAVAELAAVETQLAFFKKEVLPKIQQGIQLTERSFAAGAANLLVLLNSQTSIIEAKRKFLELLVRHRRAWLAVESALGRRLEDLPETPREDGNGANNDGGEDGGPKRPKPEERQKPKNQGKAPRGG